MRTFIYVVLISTTLATGLAPAARADFETGREAYFTKDYAKALEELAPLAEQGHAGAQSYLASMYQMGLAVPKDLEKAFLLYSSAAQKGDVLAQSRLGRLFLGDQGVARDYAVAMEWLRKAADRNHAASQHHIAVMYDRGWGVAKDRQEALKWTQKAAIGGHFPAQYNLGLAYMRGDGIAADMRMAAKWFSEAATQGHDWSQFNIGYLYATGDGVEQDETKALEWLGKAAAQGHKDAAVRLEDLRNRRRWRARKAKVKNIARPDDFAVVIGNGNYKKYGKDIPNVVPAHADADAFEAWLIKSRGLRKGNIIFLKDATSAQIESVFGNERSHKGQLFNWTKPNISNIYVYYAGHGAPASDGSSAFLVPIDASASSIELTGYPLTTLYENLKKIPAKSITLVLESCFSGASQGGYVINRTSGILVTPKLPRAPRNITIISAGKADQVASWDQDDSRSLFTKYFLLGMGGEADKSPHGNGDGKVAYAELAKYLDGTMTYYARRYYGRDQNAQIVTTAQ